MPTDPKNGQIAVHRKARVTNKVIARKIVNVFAKGPGLRIVVAVDLKLMERVQDDMW